MLQVLILTKQVGLGDQYPSTATTIYHNHLQLQACQRHLLLLLLLLLLLQRMSEAHKAWRAMDPQSSLLAITKPAQSPIEEQSRGRKGTIAIRKNKHV